MKLLEHFKELSLYHKNAEELNEILKITGNVASVTGLDFRTTAEQIQRSFSSGIGAADLFRERGVRALLGFEAGMNVSTQTPLAQTLYLIFVLKTRLN